MSRARVPILSNAFSWLAGRLSRGNVIGGLSLATKVQAHGTSVEEPQTSVASPVMGTKTALRVLQNISDFARRNAGEADQ